MKNNYKYFQFYNSIFVRQDKLTYNTQILNKEKEWEDDSNIDFNNSYSFMEITNQSLIEILSKYPNKIDDIDKNITQEDFDKMSDMDKLKYMSEVAKRANHIFENKKIK